MTSQKKNWFSAIFQISILIFLKNVNFSLKISLLWLKYSTFWIFSSNLNVNRKYLQVLTVTVALPLFLILPFRYYLIIFNESKLLIYS